MNEIGKTYIERPDFLLQAKAFLGKNLIKIFTGQRRTGKSYMMLQVMDMVRKASSENQIIFIDKELITFDFIKDEHSLVEYVNSKTEKNKQVYLFIDEVQEISNFEKALRHFHNQGAIDIWCSGSNAQMLSGELATLISGRYIEIRVFGLSYGEFLVFHQLDDTNESLHKYLKFGGLPYLIHLNLEDSIVFDYLKSINATVLLKDVVMRNSIRNVDMLEKLTRYLAEHTGSLFSAKKISDFLKSLQIKISPNIISNYLSYLASAYYVYKVSRSDMQGKKIFDFGEKFYFEDLGLRNALIGYNAAHINQFIENAVFQHLNRAGFKITVGMINDKEIDFICERGTEKLYIQCAYIMVDEKTRLREFGNLLAIPDNYPKMVVSMDEPSGGQFEGIRQIHLRDFLKTAL